MLYWNQQIHLHCNKILNIILICLLFTPLVLNASINQSKIWTYAEAKTQKEPYFFLFRTQIRFANLSWQYQELLSEFILGYEYTKNIIIAQGFTIQNDNFRLIDTNLLRLWQELLLKFRQGPLHYHLRTRLEERKHFSFKNWNYRFRQRARIRIPMTNNLSLEGYEELFIHLNKPLWITDPTIDQNRAFLGLRSKVTKNSHFKIGYLNQYIFGSPAFNNHIIHIGLHIHF